MNTYKIIYATPVIQEHKREDDSTDHILTFKQETIIVHEETPKHTLIIKEIKRTKMIQRSNVEEVTGEPLLSDGNIKLVNYEMPVISIRNISSRAWRGQVTIAPTE